MATETLKPFSRFSKLVTLGGENVNSLCWESILLHNLGTLQLLLERRALTKLDDDDINLSFIWLHSGWSSWQIISNYSIFCILERGVTVAGILPVVLSI
jgi:hypothetical protein